MTSFQLGKEKPFQQDMHWNLRQSESSDSISKTLSNKFQKYKDKSNPLLKALASTTKGSLMIKAL